MSEQTTNIEYLRNVLNRAKTDLYLNGKLDEELHEEIFEVFYEIKAHKLTVLANEVYALLNSNDSFIRRDAVAVLGFTTRLHMPEFRDKAYDIFLNDPDDSVKYTALCAWTSYYLESNNNKVLKILYNILIDNNNSSSIRDQAYYGIFTTIDILFHKRMDITRKNLLKYKTSEEFNKHIDWQELETIMRKYAPEALDGTNK